MADVGDIRPSTAVWSSHDRRPRQAPDAPPRRRSRRAERDDADDLEQERQARRKGQDASRGTNVDELV